MIQVQIASQVTATGVDGVRWVLVEVPDPTSPTAPPTPAGVTAQQAPAAGADRANRLPPALSLTLLKLLVVSVGVGLALWLAQAAFGSVRMPGWKPTGIAVPAQERLPTDARPVPARPTPPASAAGPLVTAELT